MKIAPAVLLAMLLVPLAGCGAKQKHVEPVRGRDSLPVEELATPIASPQIRRLVDAGVEQTTFTKAYDPSYIRLSYPGGDVPRERGVCSDVVVRAFRACSVDLQKEVHEDMVGNFSAYPNRWGMRGPDANIDHRRVPNLMTFFKRRGKSLPITSDAASYKPGDVVAWDLGGGLLHIGMVTNVRGEGDRYRIVHNIGAGTRVEDLLFAWRIIGHYRYFE
jgi:uncharacterized protein YijF (DUF1287 family)